MIARAADLLLESTPRPDYWSRVRVCGGLVRSFGLLQYIAIYSPTVGKLRVINIAGTTRIERETIIAHRLLEAAGRYLGRGSTEHVACLTWARGKQLGQSNAEVAARLHVSEVTLRRWRAAWCDKIAEGIQRDGLRPEETA